jgi:hypothetical protein
MKLELVKCHEMIDGKKVFVSEGNLQIAESLEDIILMTENGECNEKTAVVHFNASRRIRFQASLKTPPTKQPKNPHEVAFARMTLSQQAELISMIKDEIK